MESPLAGLSEALKVLPAALLTPVFFGAVFATTLFGATSLQSFRYFTRYTNDPRPEKCFVGVLWFLDALHLSTTLYIAYHVLVSAWNAPTLTVLLDPVFFKVIRLQVVTMILMLSYIHTLYGIMAWRLKCNVPPSVLYFVMAAILIGHGFSIFAAVQLKHVYPSAEFILDFTKFFGPSIYVCFSSATVVDLILALFVCFMLRNSNSEFSRSTSPLSTFIQYFLATGLVTCLFQLAILITCGALPKSFAFFAIEMLLPGIHANSYMALLNARKVFRHGLTCPTAPNKLLSEANLTVHISTLTAINRSGGMLSGAPHNRYNLPEKIWKTHSHDGNNSCDSAEIASISSARTVVEV